MYLRRPWLGRLDYSGSFDGRIDYTAWSDIMYDEDDVKMEVAGEEEFLMRRA